MLQYNPYVTLESASGMFLRDHRDHVSEHEVIVLAPESNTPGKADATGAFHIGAKLFCETHGIDEKNIVLFPNKKYDKAFSMELILNVMSERKPKVFVCFCHGYQYGTQFGLISPNSPKASLNDIERFCSFCGYLFDSVGSGFTAPVFVMYACSTGDDPDDDPDTAPGSGDGSLADTVRDTLCQNQATHCRVVAHTTAGHSWLNPHVKFFDGLGSPIGGVGAAMLAPTKKAKKALSKLLLTNWAFRFPFMPVPHIHQHLV